jgi:hypothetical protein
VSTVGAVNAEIKALSASKRIKVDGSRKRKKAEVKKPLSQGNVTEHYMNSIENTINGISRSLEMKKLYIIM